MIAFWLHETSSAHLHAGNSAFSLAGIAVVALTLAAGFLLLRSARRARVTKPAPQHD